MENKKISRADVLSMLRLALILLGITAVVALLLSAVNEITKDPIAQQKEQALSAAMAQVLEAQEYEPVEALEQYGLDEIVTAVYAAKKDGALVGYCVKTMPRGYGGEIEMITGVDLEGKVTKTRIVSMSETAGLGSRTQDESFLDQYAGKGIDISVTTGSSPKENEVSAIAGATVSSRAVTTGVAAAVSAAQAIKGAA